MCGIAGILVKDSKDGQILRSIDKMVACLHHRGPDSQGIHIAGNVALGHARLKIIDLVTGAQPMENEDGTVWVTFNGEIFNHHDLRTELEAGGHVFKSKSDTEVLVHGYEEWGSELPAKLRGQFAFAIMDKNTDSVFLARDHLGIKPLYYMETPKLFAFASETKALRVLIETPRPNLSALPMYLAFRYLPGSMTWFEGLTALEPGQWLRTGRGGIERGTFWAIPLPTGYTKDRPDPEFVGETTRQLVSSSISNQMESDVPLGSFLSGGLDSSIVAACNAKFAGGQVNTFTIGFREEGFNEFSYARAVANQYNTRHHEFLIHEEDYIQLLPEIISLKDGPLGVPNEVPLYVMSRRLKDFVTVVLSGEGADELFCGYGRIFRSADDLDKIGGLARFSPNEARILEENLKRLYGQVLPTTRQQHFLHLYPYVPLGILDTLWNKQVGLDSRDVQTMVRDLVEATTQVPYAEALRWMFYKLHLPGLLQRVDVTTMGASVEARVPFVDHRLVEWSLGTLAISDLLRWRSPSAEHEGRLLNGHQISEVLDVPKAPLRDAFQRDLPEEVVARKKIGFPVPLDQWARGRMGELARRFLLSEKCRNRNLWDMDAVERILNGGLGSKSPGYLVWMLLNLEIWFRLTFDGESVEEVKEALR